MYKFDPRTKLLAVMLITVVIFLVDKLSVCVILAAALILFRLMARISLNLRFSFTIKHVINLLLLAVFVLLLQTFFGGGLFLGLVIICRILCLALIFPIFTKTTPPYELAAAFHALGLQYRIAFIITTAFNQVHHFSQEACLIMDAQKLRGLQAFEKRFSPIAKIKAYTGICLPLVLGAMRKAQLSSVAMDSRAFGAHKKRTWLEKPVMKKKDYYFIIGCIAFVVLLLVMNYVDYQF